MADKGLVAVPDDLGLPVDARGMPQVKSLHSTNGRWDFIAELEARDLAGFDEALRRIRLIEGINLTESSILLKTSKIG